MRACDAALWVGTLLLASCSSGGDSDGDVEAEPGGGFLLGDPGESLLPGSETPGGADPGATCLGETREAEAIQLDMVVMLDSSASMLEALPGAGGTKWDAVIASLGTFVTSPEAADIGVGLQYFPQSNEGVPSSCSSNQECGPGGPCTNSLCVTSGELEIPDDGAPPFEFVRVAGDTPRFCATDADCGGAGESCRALAGECVFPPGAIPQNPDGAFLNVAQDPVGSVLSPLCGEQLDCQGLPETTCEEIGVCTAQLVKCSPSIGCPPGAGECVPFPYSCENQTSCEVAGYASPAVAISSGPARGDALLASLAERIPEGQTPTGPALSGALEHARRWAEQNVGRQVVTVLATDGFPTVCEPLEVGGISAIAGAALEGARPVRTFVIGVFGSADLGGDGQARLDAIARAGGTGRALLVDTDGDVTQEFLDALNQIRDTAVSCEFQLDAVGLDFDRVNLQVTDASGATRGLFNVGDVSACGGDDRGWYYVRDSAGNPIQINVCPGTCATFMGEGVRADLQIGCATRIR